VSGVSDPFLWELRKLVAAFEEVEDRWTVFWSRYEEARRQRGVWFPDLGPKLNDFQSAFREAAQQTLECRQAMPKPEDLPRLFTGWPPGWAIADTFPALLQLFADKFSAWLPGVMDPKGGFAEWNWNTDFSRDFMEQFRPLFIVPLEEAIRVYEKFLAQREAQRLAEALASQEIAPQPTASPPVSVPLVAGAQETSPGPTTTQSGPTPPTGAEYPKVEAEFCFHRDGDGWLVRAFGEQGHFRNLKGFGYIAKLLTCPGKPVPMVELIASGDANAMATLRTLATAHMPQSVLDDDARRNIKRRLEELKADIERAEQSDNFTEAEVLRNEFQRLCEHVKATTRPGGKSTRFSKSTDKMRARIANALKRAYEALRKAEMDELAAHLETSIEAQDDYYIYAPSPQVPWAL